MTRLSVIIPTLGRPTLRRAVYSVLNQMVPNTLDELIVIGDGPTPGATWIKSNLGVDYRIRYFEHGPTRCWGAAQYDFGMKQATGDWCIFLPDDDYMAANALETIRRGVEGTTDVHIFACQMLHWGNRVLRGSKNVCEVTANQIVVPNQLVRRDELTGGQDWAPRWADDKSQTFDHAYLTAMLKWYGQENPIYHDEIICVADQQNNGRVF